jgi:hypothetical protein
MYDDHVDHYRAIASNIIVAPELTQELSRQWVFRNRINTSIATRLAKTSSLQGFTGSLFPGNRVGRPAELREEVPAPAWLRDVLHLQITIVEYVEPSEDDQDDEELGRSAAQQRDYDVTGMGREEDFDEDMIIDLIENINQLDV